MSKILKKIGFLLIIGFSVLIASQNAYASTISTKRLFGTDRFKTSIEVSKSGWSNGSKNVILASGMNFPDALCSAPLAKLLDSPVLLTEPSNLSSDTLQEIKRLNPDSVYLIGGAGVLSENIKLTLASAGIRNTIRIGGSDRFDTSVKVASEIERLSGEYNSIAVASGINFPDALSIAPIAANKRMPIILTEKGFLPIESQKYLSQKNINSSYIIGGTGVVSDNVKTSLSQFSNSVVRISGVDRFDTNAQVLKEFENDMDFQNLFIAGGLNFPDALASSVLAAKGQKPSPLILTDNGNFSSGIYTLLNNNCSSIACIIAIGGSSVVPDTVFRLDQLSLKKSKIIVVDPGHGGNQPGTSGNGLVEEDVNLDISLRVRDILKNQGYTTYMTRETDTYVSLADRAAMANQLGANLFLSIHHNSVDSTSPNGTTVLYNSQANDPAMELAILMRDEIAAAIGTTKLPLQDRPNLVVLNSTNCEAVLAEILFLTNPADAEIIKQPANRQKVAEAIVRAINKYYGFR